MKTRKCLEKCIAAQPSAPCSCTCGGSCHSLGACDPQTHRFDRDGFMRKTNA